MTDAQKSPTPRRRQPRVPLVAVVGIAVAVGVIEFAIVRGVNSGGATPTTSSSACAAARDALTRQNATAQATPGNEGVLRTTANLVVENRECFDPQTVAASQAYLDKLAQGG